MSELTTIARPYAQAAFDFAVENSEVDSWQEMLVFAGEVAKNDAMKSILTGSVAAGKLAEIFISVLGDQVSEKGQNFIKVLAENDRLVALPEIAISFARLKTEYNKILDADVTSAAELSDDQKANISAALEKRFARKIQLNCNVDPALVAGLVIKAGDTVIDGSVNSKLNRLNDALQA